MLDQLPELDTQVADYRIEALLGRGGMGTVFRARHVDSGRVVALKIIANGLGSDPTRSARFQSEGRAQASLEHPHVVTIYEAGESDSGLFLAMRLIDGPPLADLIDERRLGARQALDLLGQVADALDAAHAAGLVHRDVKPQNVLVGEGNHAFLADFGLTRVGGDAALTSPGALVGTVAYLAPEVVRGDDATPASDRYAFAAMTFACLTGSVVFPRSSDASVLFAHANEPPPRASVRRPELGDELDDLFERALAKDPSERPASARELIDAVRHGLERSGAIELPPPPLTGAAALGHDTPTDAGTPSPARAAAGGPARRTAPLAALCALGGAAVVAAAWALFGGHETTPPRIAPADQAGLQYVGADLNGAPGRTVDCRGRAPAPASPACTVVQPRLPGATTVVPENGVIRRWSVRGAKGELTLVVARPREGGALQIAASSTETVGSAEVQTFPADIAVERGDLVGVRLTTGSAVGVRHGASGATTSRWLPPLTGLGRPADRGAGTGFDDELLLRVGILPGGKPRSPAQVTGAAAERVAAGRVLRRYRVPVAGRRTELALVQLGSAFAVDQLAGDRRIARIQVPDLRPDAQITRFLAAVWSPDQSGLDLAFVNEGSARVILRAYVVTRRGFVFLG